METEQGNEKAARTDETRSLVVPTSDERSSTWMAYAIQILVVVVVVTGALAIYHFSVVEKSAQKLALIDISDVISTKQLEMTELATRPDATNQDRESIYDSVTVFSKDMENAIAQIQNECGCVLLVRNAVVKTSGIEDLTPLLKSRLGLERTVAELSSAIRKNPGPRTSERVDGPQAVRAPESAKNEE